MGQITTGVGLVSGLNIADIVDQLMSIEERPKNLIVNRNAVLTAQQTAFTSINATLLGLKTSASDLVAKRVFSSTQATTSNESVLNVTSSTSASPGTYAFTVKQLVSSQRTITRGFQDTDSTAVGAGRLTFESGKAKLSAKTSVDQLNGGDGIERGLVRVTDRSGNTTLVDLSEVVTVDDVLSAFNNSLGVNVVASIEGDRLVVADNTGATTQNLAIADVGGTQTATSLGLAKSGGGTGSITGDAVNRVGTQTLLNRLNDGNGVHIVTSADFQIADGQGNTFSVNLEGATTLGNVITKINEAASTAGSQVTAAVGDDGASLKLVDAAGAGTGMTVSALNSSDAARDLGLLGSTTTDTLGGRRILATLNSKLLSNLNGGLGVSGTVNADGLSATTLLADLRGGAGLGTSGDATAELTLQGKDDQVHELDLDAMSTVQDLIDAVRDATDGEWVVAVDGNTLSFTDNTVGGGNTRITAGAGTAAAELGLDAYNSAVNTATSADLTPSSYALSLGVVRFTDRSGATADVDLTSAQTVSDVLEAINDAGLGITASLNRAGNGLLLTDTTGGTGDLTVSDQSGLAAQALGIAGTHTSATVDSGDLQYRYVTKSSLLDDLGITRGKFKITDSSGATATVDLTQGNEVTIDDVLKEINSRGLQINARLNDTGDGIVIEDTGPGSVKLKIVEDGSSTAADLGILGETTNFGDSIVGTFEKHIDITSTDTLSDVVSKINDADVGVVASVVNDGTGGSSYRLSLTGEKDGADGAFVFDDGGLGFRAVNLSEARDAVVFFGGNTGQNSLVITSKSNQLTDVIPGATISLTATSDDPVQVSISRDDDAIVEAIKGFVSKFNAVIDGLNKYDTYNSETEERGLLLGDGTVVSLRNTLYNAVIRRNTDLTGEYSSLTQVGVKIGSGSRMTFDEGKFREALQTNRDAVNDLFNFKQTEEDEDGKDVVVAAGIGVRLNELLERLTDSESGPVENKIESIKQQIDNNKSRIEDIDTLLEQKRARLEAQFIAMEKALSQMQSQSGALAQLSNVAASSKAALSAATSK